MEELVFVNALFNTHVHFRQGDVCKTVVPYTSRIFQYAGVQGNLKNNEVVTVERARVYREEIKAAAPESNFDPRFFLYLTEETSKEEIDRVADNRDLMLGVKMYQRGASGTTGSSRGIRDPKTVYPIFEHMEKRGVPVLIHAEDPNEGVDHFDRELFFLDRHLVDIVSTFPAEDISVAHVSTEEMAQFIRSQSRHVTGEITPMHLMKNRNYLWEGGLLCGHRNILPVLKREIHREAIERIVIAEESDKFWYGDDSAPHQDKNPYGCAAGGLSCVGGFEATVDFFESRDALHLLPEFMGARAIRWYGLPVIEKRLLLRKQPWQIPHEVNRIVPFFTGQTIQWQVVSE